MANTSKAVARGKGGKGPGGKPSTTGNPSGGNRDNNPPKK